jgi:hypothetical protein
MAPTRIPEARPRVRPPPRIPEARPRVRPPTRIPEARPRVSPPTRIPETNHIPLPRARLRAPATADFLARTATRPFGIATKLYATPRAPT